MPISVPIPPAPGSVENYLRIEGRLPAGTAEGNYIHTAGVFRGRLLNTVTDDPAGLFIGFIGPGRFNTNAIGTYRFRCEAPMFGVGAFKALFNYSFTNANFYGSCAVSNAGQSGDKSIVTGEITITIPNPIWTLFSQGSVGAAAPEGFGFPSNTPNGVTPTDETYSIVEMWHTP